MKSQRIPRIKLEDVERVVRRDYSETQFDSVMAVLSGYESKRERSRVLLATLKLANGNLDALRKHIGSPSGFQRCSNAGRISGILAKKIVRAGNGRQRTRSDNR